MTDKFTSSRAETDTMSGTESSRVFSPETTGFIAMNDSVSSSLVNQSGFRSAAECMYWCDDRGCAAALLNETSRVCQMLVINDESSGQPGPNGSHVTRQLGSPTDGAVRLWKSDDFEQQLRSRLFWRVFGNSSSGRNGSVQLFSAPFAACFRIEAFGAAGGRVSGIYSGLGGRGASAAGSFWLAADTRLDIVLGQAGGDTGCGFGAGGGGGSFVYNSNDTGSPRLLLAAGGGGGASWNYGGLNGSSGTNGTDSWPKGSCSGFGGSDGQPGRVSPTRDASNSLASCGAAGAGWRGPAKPSNESFEFPGGPGLSRTDGWRGGARSVSCPTGDGGFGGGGAGGGCCTGGRDGASGGGGGFSGGGAGTAVTQVGGGGGSFCSGFGCVTATGANPELQGRVLLSISAACG